MGQCRTLDADITITIGCYYGDYSSCDNTIPRSLSNFFLHTRRSTLLLYRHNSIMLIVIDSVIVPFCSKSL